MIFTQSMQELGFPKWTPRGALVLSIDGPIDSQGYGTGVRDAIEHVTRMFVQRYGSHAKMVRARFEIMPGPAHPDYRRLTIRVTGDLYLEGEP